MSRSMLPLLRSLRLAPRAPLARYSTTAPTPQRAADLAAAEAITESDSAQPPQSQSQSQSPPPAASASASASPSPSPSTRTHTRAQKPTSTYTPPSLAPLPPPRYHVARSASNNLPIYTDYKRGGNLHLTIIRKITGDSMALRDELRDLLHTKDQDVVINPLTGHVVVKGHHKTKVADFLKERGM